MKKILLALILLLGIPLATHAALVPTSWLRDNVSNFVRPNLSTDSLRIPSLTGCNTIDTDGDGDFVCGSDEGGSGPVDLTNASAVSDSNQEMLDNGFIFWNSGQFLDTLDADVFFTDGSSVFITDGAWIHKNIDDGNFKFNVEDVPAGQTITGRIGDVFEGSSGEEYIPFIEGTLTPGNCIEVGSTQYEIVDAGDPCGSGGSGAPDDADYLVGTANGGLSAEIVVGTTPGGELGGTWGSPTLDDSVTTTGWVMGTFSGTTLTAGTVNIDLLDGVGAVDMDYGSADITDHTFTTDGTGTAEIVLPTGAIDSTEILDATILAADLKAVDSPADEECLTKEDTTGDFEWQSCGAGGATAWTDIGDATGDTTIALGAHETDFTSTIDASGEAIFTLTNTDADAANDNSFLDLRHNDGADANVFYARFIGDNDGSPTNDYLFSQTLATFGVPLTLGTSNSLTAGSIELGHASDTTIARASAGQANLEGVAIDTASNTLTLTNKTIASASNVVDACIPVAVTDEYSNLTTGTAKVSFRMPFAMTVTSVRASLVTVATGATLVTVDINEAGTTILSTKLTFDASELTTTTAATAAVVSDSSLADDALMTVDIDAVGNTTTGNGLKISICGTI